MRSVHKFNFAPFSGVILLVSLAGCGGHTGPGAGGGGAVDPFKNQTFSEKTIPLGGPTGTLTVKVAADDSISGTLVTLGSLPARAAPTTYPFTGAFTDENGDFTGTFSALTNSSLSGTLPRGTHTGGTFTIDLNGAMYGPHPFGGSVGGGGGGSHFFTVQELGLLPGASYSQPNDINDSGTVVGVSDKNDGFSSAFVWSHAGGLRDLGVTNAKFSNALGINNAGSIVGNFTPLDGDLSHPHVFTSSGAGGSDLGIFGSYNAEQTVGITESGAMVGEAYKLGGASIPSAVVIFHSGYTDVSFMHEADLIGFSKQGGQILGDIFDDHHISVYWQSTGLGVGTSFPASFFSNITLPAQIPECRMGPAGQVLASRKDNSHAAIFPLGGGVTDLGQAGTAIGMNAAGTVVFNGGGAFMWTASGGAVDINSLIDPSLGISVIRVWGINASGQMICTAHTSTITSPTGEAIVVTPPAQ